MVYRTRIKYTSEQKAEIWDRWKRGESLNSIGRLFDRGSSSIFTLLAPTGGIRPIPRRSYYQAGVCCLNIRLPRGRVFLFTFLSVTISRIRIESAVTVKIMTSSCAGRS